jgi:hypothetical protein
MLGSVVFSGIILLHRRAAWGIPFDGIVGDYGVNPNTISQDTGREGLGCQ